MSNDLEAKARAALMTGRQLAADLDRITAPAMIKAPIMRAANLQLHTLAMLVELGRAVDALEVGSRG